MIQNKFTYLLLACFFISTANFAQSNNTDWGWNWRDSSKVSAKHMPQQKKFLRNEFPYPARPNNKMELGISVGYPFIMSEIRPDWRGVNNNPSIGLGVSLRKAVSHSCLLELVIIT